MLLFLAVLLAQAPSQTPAPDTYADPDAQRLVARARAARDRNERLVTSYTASVSQRMGAGIHALSRDRMLYHEELTANIAWKRDAQSTITVTGARRGLPLIKNGLQVPGDLDASVRWLVVNPAEDYLGLLGDEDDGFVYPLKEAAEQDYRYATGDTTRITLQSGKEIRVLELKISPRRADWRLMSGSLWFDDETAGLVRAVFRPARAYDLRKDGDKEDLEDVPSWVNATGEIRFITLEYSLHDSRWWMLRYAALDAVGTMGSWLGIPIKFERVYSDYEVEGGTPPPAGSSFRPAGTARKRDSVSAAERSATLAVWRDSVRAARRECLARAEGPRESRECRRLRRWPGDTALAVIVPADTQALLVSPTLGPPILQMGDLITEPEIRSFGDAIAKLGGAPSIGGSQLRVPKNLSALLQNARYNRVEGLSLGARARAATGRVTFDALGRLGIADLIPNAELGIGLVGRSGRIRLGGYRRLDVANPDTRAFGPVNSATGLLAQRDDGEYFRSLGVELTGGNSYTNRWSWRIYGERQRTAAVETDFSLPHLLNGDRRFRPNLVADSAFQWGAQLVLRGNHSFSSVLQFGGEAALEAATGDFRYGKAAATFRAIVTPRAVMAMAFEVSAGTSTGSVPAQGRFYLGGPATLRGYDGGVTAGSGYWRGRMEIGNTFPAARITLFSDIGWAGDRARFGKDRALISAGAGASFFDGLMRLDLARALRAPTGWRFDLYFDGRL